MKKDSDFRCIKCHTLKPTGQFDRAAHVKRGHYGKCKECRRIYIRQWAQTETGKANTEKYRATVKAHLASSPEAREVERKRSREKYSRNKDRIKEQSKFYKKPSSEDTRRYQLKHEYGITPEQYEAILNSQNGQCAICFEVLGKSKHLDHNHQTKQIRAILCSRCNQGLGLLREDLVIIESAIAYLLKNN